MLLILKNSHCSKKTMTHNLSLPNKRVTQYVKYAFAGKVEYTIQMVFPALPARTTFAP
jgi:hypothetical protein